MGKRVVANDQLHFCYHAANAMVANSSVILDDDDVLSLLEYNRKAKRFIERNFQGLYFSDSENRFLDQLAANLSALSNPEKRSIAISAASRACLKRRARGVFTYVGNRYDDGRRDLQASLQDHFLEAAKVVNLAVFDSGTDCSATIGDAFELQSDCDLVYLDPPYVSASSDNDYSRRYHFVEGFARYWRGLEIQPQTVTRKFRRITSRFDSAHSVVSAFDQMFAKFADRAIVLSYSSRGIPDRQELVRLLRKYKRRVHVEAMNYNYSFGTHAHKRGNAANRVEELVFVAE